MEREARAAYLQRQMDAERQRVKALQEIRETGWKKVREWQWGVPCGGPGMLAGRKAGRRAWGGEERDEQAANGMCKLL